MEKQEERKKILLSAEHPAVHISSWIDELSSRYDVIPVYYSKTYWGKPLEDTSRFPGLYMEDVPFSQIRQELKSAHFVLLDGELQLPETRRLLFQAAKAGKKAVIYCANPESNLSFVAKLYLRFFVKGMICTTSGTADLYKRQYKFPRERITLVPYAHHYTEIPAGINEARMAELDSGAKIRLLTVNDFLPRKGYRILFEALKKLKDKQQLEKFDITIIGTGEEYVKYHDKMLALSNRITMPGWVEDEECMKLMQNTDVYIHASIKDNFGIPPVDALSNGKLLLISDAVPSCSPLIMDGVNGMRYPASNSDELMKRLVKIIGMGPTIYNLGAKGAELVPKHFQPEMLLNAVAKYMA